MKSIIVFKREGRPYFEAQWVDPVTGRKRTRTTKKTTRRDAERWVAKNESKLLGIDQTKGKVTWADFRKRFESEALHGLAKKTVCKNKTTLNKVESIVSPAYVESVDTRAVEQFISHLYGSGNQPDTIITHVVILRKALRWAYKRKIIHAMPEIDVPKRVPARRGRAITQEEFDRILKAVPKVVGPYHAESWEFLISGLWWSGLRIGEAMNLHWTKDEFISIDMSDRLPMFTIQAHAEKGRKTRSLPMAPEFSQLIEGKIRKGYVFDPERTVPPFGVRLGVDRVGKVISKIGEEAGVKVSDVDGKVKFASAHDFRRSFGLRWAQRVLPATLMELMRHESIETTMKYYVGRNAQIAAQAAWDAVTGLANTSTNIPGFSDSSELTERSEA